MLAQIVACCMRFIEDSRVAKATIFCGTVFCFSRVAEHHLHKHTISSWQISKGQAVDGKPETHRGDEKDWGDAHL
jgi:hypothetical protein